MALQGTLDSFSLPDVLRLLASTGKSGRLHVEGDRGDGSVWIDSGAIVGAAASRALDDASVDEVVFEMLRFAEGSFNFLTGEEPEEQGDSIEVDKALSHASELLEEWRELEVVVPSLEHRVAIAPELTVDQVTVDAARWKSLVMLAHGVTVAELGTSLSQGELSVSRTVNDLVELGVAVVEEPQEGTSARSTTRRRSADRNGRGGPESSRRPNGNGAGAPRERDPAATEATVAAWRREEAARNGVDHNGGSGPDANQYLSARPDERAEDANGANGNGLPRRSRATGKRGGRQAAGPSAPAPAAPAAPAAPPAPFTNGAAPQGSPVAPVAPAPSSGQGLAGLPAFNNNDSAGVAAGLDTGLLGPSPLPHDSGQVPAMAPSSLPPDLNWAADDDDDHLGAPPRLSPPLGTPPVGRGSPPQGAPMMGGGMRSGPMPAGPTTGPTGPGGHAPALAEGEMAAHVSVLSAEARDAVEATVGAAGGGSGVVPAAGATPEENMQRGALLGFLASVRH